MALDFTLLPALEALLAEGSVVGAARVLGLSASAMSRTLARLRAATGDPLLVRAGRNLVPTPRAGLLREQLPQLMEQARAVLRPAPTGLDLASLERVFTIRANEGFVEAFAARLAERITAAAPGVRLRFAPKPDKDVRLLRDGAVDLEIGVLGETGPEVRLQALFRDHFIGVVRAGHELTEGDITAPRYAACGHVVASRRGRAGGPVDEALAEIGLARRVVVVVPGFPAALAVASASDLVALVTSSFVLAEQERRTRNGGDPVVCFPAPGSDAGHHGVADMAPKIGRRPRTSMAAGCDSGDVRQPVREGRCSFLKKRTKKLFNDKSFFVSFFSKKENSLPGYGLPGSKYRFSSRP